MTPDSGPPDRIGSVLAGRYRILSLLGEGAMGAVYLGEHLRIGRKDAIKVLRPALVRDDEAIARFTRGARNASGLRHPNVCAIYDFGTTEDGAHFLAMEYVDGGNLSGLLDDTGRLDPTRAVALLVQAAGALQVAHDRGIIHRDLKPDNIMLAQGTDGSEQVKVVDFDISLGPPDGEGARVTRHGYVVGTPEYMSPEQLTGDPLGPASDIYSLALVFFRMLTGRLPFDGGTAQEVMVNRLTVDPMALADAAPEAALPPELENVFRKALQRKSEDRFSSATEFAGAVRAAVRGEAMEFGADAPGAPAAAPSSSTPSSPGGGGAGAGAPPAQAARAGSGPPAPAPGGDPTIPPTRVSSSGDGSALAPPSGSSGAVAGGTDDRRRWLMAGGAGVVVLFLVAVVAIFMLNGSDPELAHETDGSEDLALVEPDAEDTGADADAAGDASNVGDDPSGNTAADPPQAQSDPPPTQTETPPTEPDPPPLEERAAEVQEGSVSRPADVREIDVTGIDPVDLLIRQLSHGADAAGMAAVRDTAWATWQQATMSRQDSAMAAYLVGSSIVPLGDSARGVGWLEEAVRLDPQPSYQNLLERYRGGTP